MALTLPYPDMVFVPLDILTAEEQNQLVGNIEFLANQFPLAASNIANGAIGSDQLADEAVTADKIDFSTLPHYVKVGDGDSFVNVEKTWDTYNIPTAGVYFVLFSITGNCQTGATTMRAQINKNGALQVWNASTTYNSYNETIATTLLTCNANDTLTATYRTDIANGTVEPYSNWAFIVLRVA